MMSSLIILFVFYFLALMDSIIVHMVLAQKREWSWLKRENEVLCNALITTHVYSIMVFISYVDMTFSWMVLPLF
jgi:hypothetical protein